MYLFLIILFFYYAAWIGSISIALCLFFGPFASSLVNWLGCRAVAVTGCLTSLLSLTIASFAKNLIILYLTFGLLGLGASCVFVSSLGIVPRCFDKRKSIAIGIASTGQGVGTMILSQVLQSLVNAFGWRNALRTVAGALVINGLLGLLYNPMTEHVRSDELLSSEGEKRASKRFIFHFSVWKLPRFLVLTVTGFFFQLSRSVIYVHLVSSFQQSSFSIGTHMYFSLILQAGFVSACSYRRGGGRCEATSRYQCACVTNYLEGKGVKLT